MNARNYVILKDSNCRVVKLYIGPAETTKNIKVVAAAIENVTRALVKEYYSDGMDVIVARGSNLRLVKRSLPELNWSSIATHYHLITA